MGGIHEVPDSLLRSLPKWRIADSGWQGLEGTVILEIIHDYASPAKRTPAFPTDTLIQLPFASGTGGTWRPMKFSNHL